MEQNNSETPTEPNGSTNGAAGNVNNSAALQMFAQPTPAGEVSPEFMFCLHKLAMMKYS